MQLCLHETKNKNHPCINHLKMMDLIVQSNRSFDDALKNVILTNFSSHCQPTFGNQNEANGISIGFHHSLVIIRKVKSKVEKRQDWPGCQRPICLSDRPTRSQPSFALLALLPTHYPSTHPPAKASFSTQVICHTSIVKWKTWHCLAIIYHDVA